MTIAELKLAVKTLTYLCRIEKDGPAKKYLEEALAKAQADLDRAQ
jgi:hypothetical protein